MPKLPYAMEALTPEMSSETLQYHYGKHLQTYVNNLNNLIKGTPFENEPLEEIVKKSEGGIFNNAGQVWNHTMFFMELSPEPKKAPTGKLAEAITRDFVSLEQFKEAFTKAALTLFGSGWVWLSKDKDGKLFITQESNAGNPLKKGFTPIMNLDVWEHAYYIDYRNDRATFIKNFWEKLDWAYVEKKYNQ